MASVCIVCQKDVTGKRAVAVKDDAIIRAIRAVKRFFRIAQNNELYVCEDDIAAHGKKRKDFEKSLVFFGVLAALVVVLLVATLVLSGRFELIAFLSSLIIGAFILLFAVVFKYAPALETAPGVVPGSGKKPQVPSGLEELDEEKAKSGPRGAAAKKQAARKR